MGVACLIEVKEAGWEWLVIITGALLANVVLANLDRKVIPASGLCLFYRSGCFGDLFADECNF